MSAREDGFNTGRLFLNHIIEYGFKGQIYLVNPKGGEVLGLKIYPQLQDIPGASGLCHLVHSGPLSWPS